MRIARVIHVSERALSLDVSDTPARCPLQRRVEDLYAVMEGLRDDGSGVPVILVVARHGNSLKARLPGLYRMDDEGEILVSSSDGVEYVERRAEPEEIAFPRATLH